jgi:hypothetical protein
MGVENPDRTFDDQPMQIVRSNDIAEGFAQTMKKIEDQIFLDLDCFIRALEGADLPTLTLIGEQPATSAATSSPKKRKRMEPKLTYFAGLSCRRSCLRYSRTSLNG